jgi:7-carboxy-7-deazaguanine synthase
VSREDGAISANLFEIFSSIQGEGTHVGEATLFVRFGECDLRCRWCDTPHTWKPASACRIEVARGCGEFESRENPVTVADVLAAAEKLELPAHAFASLTGGEPLLQPEAVSAIARALRERGPRIHLETHGLATAALESVIADVDVVSMDWKLSSDVRRASDPKRGEVAPFHDEHEKFLAVARHAPELVVKLVITASSEDAEIDEAVTRVEAGAPEATLILQPVTPVGGVTGVPTAERLLTLCARISRRLRDVRVIPQTHKIYGAL